MAVAAADATSSSSSGSIGFVVVLFSTEKMIDILNSICGMTGLTETRWILWKKGNFYARNFFLFHRE
jgi:hypothetical protein